MMKRNHLNLGPSSGGEGELCKQEKEKAKIHTRQHKSKMNVTTILAD